jgi:hypothetical protein
LLEKHMWIKGKLLEGNCSKFLDCFWIGDNCFTFCFVWDELAGRKRLGRWVILEFYEDFLGSFFCLFLVASFVKRNLVALNQISKKLLEASIEEISPHFKINPSSNSVENINIWFLHEFFISNQEKRILETKKQLKKFLNNLKHINKVFDLRLHHPNQAID